MKKARYTTLEGEPRIYEYDETAPCICCGKPVIEASVGGTIICPWCDMGVDRNDPTAHIWRPYGPSNPHPKYIEYYKAREQESETSLSNPSPAGQEVSDDNT